jgi:hypothetical protein
MCRGFTCSEMAKSMSAQSLLVMTGSRAFLARTICPFRLPRMRDTLGTRTRGKERVTKKRQREEKHPFALTQKPTHHASYLSFYFFIILSNTLHFLCVINCSYLKVRLALDSTMPGSTHRHSTSGPAFSRTCRGVSMNRGYKR